MVRECSAAPCLGAAQPPLTTKEKGRFPGPRPAPLELLPCLPYRTVSCTMHRVEWYWSIRAGRLGTGLWVLAP